MRDYEALLFAVRFCIFRIYSESFQSFRGVILEYCARIVTLYQSLLPNVSVPYACLVKSFDRGYVFQLGALLIRL